MNNTPAASEYLELKQFIALQPARKVAKYSGIVIDGVSRIENDNSNRSIPLEETMTTSNTDRSEGSAPPGAREEEG